MIQVLFVCMGNICRSPTAEGVFTHLVNQAGLSHKIKVGSAGTHAHFAGNPPDLRSQLAARQRGIDLSHIRARQITRNDFIQSDYILAMDRDNYAVLHSCCPTGHEYKLRLFLEFAPHLKQQEVPDPYYEGINGFERVLNLVESAGVGLLNDLTKYFSHD